MKMSLRAKAGVIILIALVLSFGAYITVSTNYNAGMYLPQIQEKISRTFKLNLEKVNRYTDSMEQKTTDLALTGMSFYNLKQKNSIASVDDEMIAYLTENFKTFPEAIGGGIWYEPNTIYADKQYYGPYAFWDNGQVTFTWDLNTPTYDYLNQGWYTLALPTDWSRDQKRPSEYYWTSPYYDEAGSGALMITVDAFMYDTNGKIIGISTTDWAMTDMLKFLENNKATADSHSFLIDSTGVVMANTLDTSLVMKNKAESEWLSNIKESSTGDVETINNVEYSIYTAVSDAGMIYGIMVPTKTIYSPVSMLVRLNIIMSVIFGLVLLIVLFLFLNKIINPIKRLTEVSKKVFDGDANAEVEVIQTGDEVQELSESVSMLVGAIRYLRNEKKQ